MHQRDDIENAEHTLFGLEEVAESLGWTSLERFLSDNPGACESVILWVLEHGCNKDGTKLRC